MIKLTLNNLLKIRASLETRDPIIVKIEMHPQDIKQLIIDVPPVDTDKVTFGTPIVENSDLIPGMGKMFFSDGGIRRFVCPRSWTYNQDKK